MIILGVDPARAGQTAAQHAELLADIGGDFEAGKDAGHGNLKWLRFGSDEQADSHGPRRLRVRDSSSSTLGRMPATILSTPVASGWTPSRWLKLASPAMPSRKKG